MPIDGNDDRNNLLGTLLADVMNGFGDNDTLRGSDGADTLNGGDDDDVLFAVNDPIDHDRFDDPVHDYTLFGDGQADVLNGEDGDDELVGDYRSIYDGGTGEDRAFVGLTEATSAVTFNYGGGSAIAFSFVIGGVNRGSMIGVEHVDLYGSAFNDSISLAAGDDRVQAFAGNDTLNGNGGNDDLRGGDGHDSVIGGSGRDTLSGGAGTDNLSGGDENDKLFANGEPESYTRFDDPETDFTTFGSGESDTLLGGGGSDHLVGDHYSIYDGGAGAGDIAFVSVVNSDTALNFTYGGSDATPYSFFTGGVARGSAMNIENFVLYGTNFADTVTLHDGSDRVQGNGGNDVIDGMDGRDTLAGGDGADLLNGGEANDVLLSVADVGDYSTFDDDSIDKDDFGDGAAETLNGGNGNDELVGDLWAIYHGDGGNDRAFVSFTEASAAMSFTHTALEAAPDYFMMGGIARGSAYDVENFDIYGSAFGDVFNMHTGDDRIEGMGGADTINGGEGDDVLRGGSADDIIEGGLDDDELGGNVGVDTLNGGHGNDIIFALIEPQGYDRFGRPSGDTLNVFGYHEADRLNGGDGDDWLIGDYYVLMDGGTGGDRAYVSLFDAVSAVTFTYDGAADTPYSFVIGGTNFGNIRNVENFDIYGSLFDDVLTLADGDDNIQALEGHDLLVGNGGNDQLRGNLGNDTAAGGAGDDTLTGGEDSDSLTGGDGNDVLFAELEPDDYEIFEDRSTDYEDHGSAQADILNAGAGDDRLIGDHFTTYIGGTGIDRAYISLFEAVGGVSFNYGGVAGTYAFFVGGLPHGTVNGVEAFDLYGSEYGDNVTLAGGADNVQGLGGNDTLNGGSGNDVLHGGEGDDRLVGGLGADTLVGGLGDDTYGVTTADDLIVETDEVGSGRDTIERNTSSTLVGVVNIENLRLVGSAAIDGTGNEFDNVVTGNTGNNVLAGGAGNDTLVAGGGNDTLIGGVGDDVYREVTGDMVVELAGEGADAIESATNFSLGSVANIENLTLIGAAHAGATGDNLANRITGNTGNNLLSGLGGIDTLNGGDGNDTVDGGAGADSMAGGKGDDSYQISELGDVVTELVNEGNDTILTTLAWTLGANFEHLRLQGSGNINGTGNELNNRLYGNSGANNLQGLAGNDSLTGGDRADSLDGGIGTDTLVGGSGNDSYYVDVGTDQAIEAAGAGNDTVYSSINWRLGANFETARLQGTGNVNAIGNELRNWLYGNDGSNRLQGLDGDDSLVGGGGGDDLDGGAGSDTMVGGAGNDIFRVDAGTDRAFEDVGEGTDTVYSTVNWRLGANFEVLRLQGAGKINGLGNDDANQIYGNGGANTLQGFAGNDLLDGGSSADRLEGGAGTDTLAGGGGDDTLTGGSEADVFRFAAVNAGTDRVADFSTALDRFDLSGGSFTAVTEANGNTRLTHDGGLILVIGVTGLDLAQWNDRVLPPGGGLFPVSSTSSESASTHNLSWLAEVSRFDIGLSGADLERPVYLGAVDFA